MLNFYIGWLVKLPILTLGGWLNLLSVLQITVQVLLLGKKCKPVEIIIQTVLAFVYGYLTNLSCLLIKGVHVTTYMQQLISALDEIGVPAPGLKIKVILNLFIYIN